MSNIQFFTVVKLLGYMLGALKGDTDQQRESMDKFYQTIDEAIDEIKRGM